MDFKPTDEELLHLKERRATQDSETDQKTRFDALMKKREGGWTNDEQAFMGKMIHEGLRAMGH